MREMFVHREAACSLARSLARARWREAVQMQRLQRSIYAVLQSKLAYEEKPQQAWYYFVTIRAACGGRCYSYYWLFTKLCTTRGGV